MAASPLLFRCEADNKTGIGHAMRCLALAQGWLEAGGKAVFLMKESATAFTQRLNSEGIKVSFLRTGCGSHEDALATIELANQIDASWAIVDGYEFKDVYQEIVKDSGQSMMVIDDFGHADHYYADIILNQNIYAREEMYKPVIEPPAKLLLGTKYALLRREFRKRPRLARDIPFVATKVLVTLGGGDPDNVTKKVLEALTISERKDLEVVAVVGPTNRRFPELQAIIERTGCSFIKLIQNAINMPDLMAWADIGITAGGSTSWELAFMGLPCINIILADNQKLIAEGLDSANISINLGRHENVTALDILSAFTDLSEAAEERARMAKAGQALVDGAGPVRVIEVLGSLQKVET